MSQPEDDEDLLPLALHPGLWTPELIAAFNGIPGALVGAVLSTALGDTPEGRFARDFERAGNNPFVGDELHYRKDASE